MSDEIGRRSVLCVPAAEPAKVHKALASGADEVVIDLEDAVAESAKIAARSALVDELRADGRRAASADGRAAVRARGRTAVRVNAVGSPWCHDDVLAAAAAGVDSVVIPKVESRADIAFVERVLDSVGSGLRVQALIETPTSVVRLAETVAGRDRLEAVIVGYADLAAALGIDGEGANWDYVQQSVLLHARAAGIEAIEGPYLRVDADAGFRRAVGHAAAAGFDGMWVIHPRQIDAVNEAFAPQPAAVSRARRVLEALGSAQADGRGAIRLDGELIDEAMAVSARRVLARARG